jgi:hypothetical protein
MKKEDIRVAKPKSLSFFGDDDWKLRSIVHGCACEESW